MSTSSSSNISPATAIATLKWAHALTINLASDFDLEPRHLAPVDLDASRDHVAYFGYGAPTNVTVVHFDALTLKACNESDFQVHHVAPILDNGWAYLGEPAKWVPVAEKRTRALSWDDAGLRLELAGAPNEPITLAFYAPNKTLVAVDCVLGAAGTAALAVSHAGATCV